MNAQITKTHRTRDRIQTSPLTGRADFIVDMLVLGQIQLVGIFNASRHLQTGTKTARTPAMFGVVRKQARIRLGETGAATGAGTLGREGCRFGADAPEGE